MSEQTRGTISGGTQGIASGASLGFAVGGPLGAVIGGIAGGIVGGIGGAIAGKHGKKAKKYMRMAMQVQQKREKEAYRQQYLSVLRQGRIQRASSLAAAVAMGIESSSGAQASLSSIGSQIANQVEYMSVDRGREVLVSELLAKAKKQQQKSSNTMGMVSTGATIVGAIGTAVSLAGAMTASAAASEAAGKGAGGMAQASGIGSSAATSSASGIAGTTGPGIVGSGSGVAFSNTAGYFSSGVWDQAASQLYTRAMLQQSLTSATMQVGRSYYSGTRLVTV